MEWTPVYPKKPGYYWAFLQSETVTILLRSGRNGVWGFGGDSVDPKKVRCWGELVVVPDAWSKIEAADEGWYGVKYDNKTEGIVRVAKGERIHCYDFELPSEIDYKQIVAWNGVLPTPPPPAKAA